MSYIMLGTRRIQARLPSPSPEFRCLEEIPVQYLMPTLELTPPAIYNQRHWNESTRRWDIFSRARYGSLLRIDRPTHHPRAAS